MTFEIQCPLKLNRGTIRKPKWEVFDLHGNTVFSLSSATWLLKNTKTGEEIDSGSATVNNADTDTAGNTIKTVQPTIDLERTDPVNLGMYQISFKIKFTNGESDVMRQPIEIVDFEEVT